MDFALTDEQKLMVETARRVGEQYGLDDWAASTPPLKYRATAGRRSATPGWAASWCRKTMAAPAWA
jgi:hypothetical protein